MMTAARLPARSEPANNQFFLLWKSFSKHRGCLFADTVAGAQASANLYSLVETCLCRMRHRQVHAESRTMPN